MLTRDINTVINSIEDLKDIELFNIYYCKKELIQLRVFEKIIEVIDIKEAMQKGKTCKVYRAEYKDLKNIDFMSIINQNNYAEELKSIEVYSPFYEVKQDQKVYTSLNKTNVVKMLLNGAVKRCIQKIQAIDYGNDDIKLVSQADIIQDIMGHGGFKHANFASSKKIDVFLYLGNHITLYLN